MPSAAPQPVYFANIAQLDRPGLPHGRGVWRDGPGQPQPTALAGNSPFPDIPFPADILRLPRVVGKRIFLL